METPDSNSGNKEKPQLAPIRAMFVGLTRCDKIMYIIAVIFAGVSGCAMPTFAILFSEMIDSFDPDTPIDELLGEFCHPLLRFMSNLFVYRGHRVHCTRICDLRMSTLGCDIHFLRIFKRGS